MKKRNRFSKWVIGFSSVLIIFDLGFGSSPGQAADKATLKVVSAWPQNNKMNDALRMLQKRVTEKSNGMLEIAWAGGPEAIPAFQLVEALRNNVVDVAWTAHTYNVAQVPVVEGAKLSRITPWKEREIGVFDFYGTSIRRS